MGQQKIEAPLLGTYYGSSVSEKKKQRWVNGLFILLALFTISIAGVVYKDKISSWVVSFEENKEINEGIFGENISDVIESNKGVVAADDWRCSEIGASMLRRHGHAVDAAVATALCLGIVNPMASGIGGGSFMIVRNNAKTQAFDMRETAPAAATEDMYENNPDAKMFGPLSIAVPGEIAGLHEAWLQHGRLAWSSLFQPAIKLAKEGFVIAPYLEIYLTRFSDTILKDPGLRQVFAPNGKVLKAGDICYNVELGKTLEEVAEKGPQAFYNGSVGEKLVKDVREAGGILTMEDLRNYKVDVMDAMTADVMGYTIFGMPPPSSGTLGLSLVVNILKSYKSFYAANRDLGLHRLIESLKHMFAVRMNLGDPHFVNVDKYMDKMLSPDFAKKLQQKIFDNTTFPPEYYMTKYSQLRDHGTSHICIVDSDRNAVSMTTTVNYYFGSGVLSTSTGIVLNDEMGDFSTPTEITPDSLPPAPANFIRPNKRPLSSMTPLIITKDNQLVGAIGGSGGIYIIPAVVQVFLNHFALGMKPLAAVQSPRIYHMLKPNVVLYENWTVINGDHIELSDEKKNFLRERGHELMAQASGAIVQLIIQSEPKAVDMGRKNPKDPNNGPVFHGTLTAVSDPRKNGKPAAV